MSIEIALLISMISVGFGVFSAISSYSRAKKHEQKKDTTEMTTVIIKLENISTGILEIKADLNNIKGEVKELRERMIIIEQSTKQAHRRIDEIKGVDIYGNKKENT